MPQSSPKVAMRVGCLNDASSIRYVLEAAFGPLREHYDELGYRRTVPNIQTIATRIKSERWWTASLEGSTVGTISASVVENACRIRSLAVLEKARNKGIGQALLSAAEEFALARRATQLVLVTADFLASATRLYDSFGFTRIALDRNVMIGRTRGFEMRKPLEPAASHAEKCRSPSQARS